MGVRLIRPFNSDGGIAGRCADQVVEADHVEDVDVAVLVAVGVVGGGGSSHY